jgi:hypothetical protein
MTRSRRGTPAAERRWQVPTLGASPGLMRMPRRAPGIPSYESFEPARHAMGDTLRYAQRMRLIALQPRDDLSSTAYALAHPGEEYLVLQPSETADPFSVTLTFSVGAQALPLGRGIAPSPRCVLFSVCKVL